MEKALREKLTGGKFENVSATDSKRMSAVKGRGNKSTELLYRLMLVRAGIKGWKMHPEGIVGKPDFYFPIEGVAVFVDGCFWHGCSRCGHVPKANNSFWSAKLERTRERDVEKVAKLQAEGIRSLRIWGARNQGRRPILHCPTPGPNFFQGKLTGSLGGKLRSLGSDFVFGFFVLE